MIKGEDFNGSGIHISHLQFADDTILLIQPKIEFVLNAKRILWCFDVKLPFSYLGFPIGSKPYSKAFWNPVVDQIEARLAPWKRRDNSMSATLLHVGMRVIIGNGVKADFWRDIKIDTVALKESFSRIFALVSKKEGVISDFGLWEGSSWVWRVPLRRRVFGWEDGQWNSFLTVLHSINIREWIDDILAWSFNSEWDVLSQIVL
ncbi:hypothetical protein Dsin_011873 [Dipteronia sinensis]|uniref:Reverse transcriptase domain-containing protein n=1 Tax=Dipteronia sinensis TaxID=43782 RepID=A0AAE0AGY7_9ROSI|nr:hypothetical protein Dsin_011873 [Dipteronia sinensis]